jgi:hypothetical protein
MSRKRTLSAKGEIKKEKRQFLRRLRRDFKHMPRGYNPYSRPPDIDAPAEPTRSISGDS